MPELPKATSMSTRVHNAVTMRQECRPRRLARPTAKRQSEHATLTRTQSALLGYVARGLTNVEVAHAMSITVGTTKWHLHEIFKRLGVRNRTAAVARARQLGLLQRV